VFETFIVEFLCSASTTTSSVMTKSVVNRSVERYSDVVVCFLKVSVPRMYWLGASAQKFLEHFCDKRDRVLSCICNCVTCCNSYCWLMSWLMGCIFCAVCREAVVMAYDAISNNWNCSGFCMIQTFLTLFCVSERKRSFSNNNICSVSFTLAFPYFFRSVVSGLMRR